IEHFASTRWSVVVDARDELTPQGQMALTTLCEWYWYPLYAYLRRCGYATDDAQDLTQGFFEHLLEKRALHVVDRSRGRFRSFLLTSLNHYVSNVRARQRAEKRGGRVQMLSLD